MAWCVRLAWSIGDLLDAVLTVALGGMGVDDLDPAVVGQPGRLPHLASIGWYC
jgi:hypothetical protein